MKTDRELIDEWLKTHEPTRCPPAHCAPSQHAAFGMSDCSMPGMKFGWHGGSRWLAHTDWISYFHRGEVRNVQAHVTSGDMRKGLWKP